MRELLNRTVAWRAVNGTDGLVEIPTLFDGEYEVLDDRAMAPPQHRRSSSPRRAGRRARPPGCHERAGRSHPLGTPRNPTQAARAYRGVSTRYDRQLLVDWRATSSLLPLCREMFSNGLRALSELRRSSRATRDSKSCRTRAAGRERETTAGDFRFDVLGAPARRLTGESPVSLIVQRGRRPWFLTGGLTNYITFQSPF